MIIFLNRKSIIKRKHSNRNIWLFSKNLKWNMMKNICLNGITNRFIFFHPFGVIVPLLQYFYNHNTPSGFFVKCIQPGNGFLIQNKRIYNKAILHFPYQYRQPAQVSIVINIKLLYRNEHFLNKIDYP
jgi:hypothetical protein